MGQGVLGDPPMLRRAYEGRRSPLGIIGRVGFGVWNPLNRRLLDPREMRKVEEFRWLVESLRPPSQPRGPRR